MADVRAASGRFKALEHHRARRARGTVTVTVLLGNEDAGEWIWRRFHAHGDRATVVSGRVEHTELLEEWLEQGNAWEPVRQWVLEQAADRQGVPIPELLARTRARSPRQRKALADELGLAMDCPSAVVHAALFDAEEPLRVLVRAFPESLRVLERMGGGALAGLLLRRPERGAASWEVAAARALLEIAERAPWLDAGLVVSERGWAAVESALPDRQRTLLAEGLTRVAPPSPASNPAAHTTASGRRATRSRAPAGRAARSPSNGQAQNDPEGPRRPSRNEPTRPQPGAPTASPVIILDNEEFARSQAELRLYRALQGRPRTRDLFTLNQKLALRFESGAAEVDLSCEALGIAVEVDGYRHFQDEVAYRRDRRKDLLLQEAGYWVVRVLASDVTAELDSVLALIDRAVEHRRGKIE